MPQNRQITLGYNEELKEYKVQLFINGIYQKGADYFTDDGKDAIETAEEMKKQLKPQKDFCKTEEKKAIQTESKEQNEHYIYLINGDFVGSIYLDADKLLPEKIEISGMMYDKRAKMNVIIKE